MSSNDSPSTNDREAIVDKLHGALAVFRRECDELHRKKQLAVERLRLEQEEKDATEKTIHGMQETLNQLNKSGSEEAKRELEQMEKDVEQMNREVQFQHSELLAKRSKFESLKIQMKEDAQVRAASIRAAQDALARRKEIAHNQTKQKGGLVATTTMASRQLGRFRQELEHETDMKHFLSKCPLLIEQNATAHSMEACDIHRETETLTRILAGYQHRFADCIPGDTGMMESCAVSNATTTQ